MQFSDILGQEHIKNHLITNVKAGRIPHAQLFVGPEGSGTLAMAIAYSQYILCPNSRGEDSAGNDSCNLKFNSISHPDLHFIYPIATNEEIKSHPTSSDFFKYWREFITDSVYGSIFDWYKHIGIQNKQGQIGVDDALEVIKALSLKSYEGGYKVMIIWMADKMNIASANKLLKIIEEPPARTLFILITENEENIIQTIRSRCQVLHFNAISEKTIADTLIFKKGIEANSALKIAYQSQGNYNKALQLLEDNNEDTSFDEWFVMLVRAAFRAKGNAAAIQDLIVWSENIASLGREAQKKFLHYCIDLFRQALLTNYKVSSLVYIKPKAEKFKMENFASFVNGNNINEIFKDLSQAIYHIERNGNSKIILTDLSIRLTRLIHKK